VVTIHGLSDPTANGSVHHVGRELEHVAELSPLQAVEIAENILLGPSARGPSDPNAATHEAGPTAVRHHGAKPVVTGRAATVLQTHHAKLEVELVVNTKDLIEA